MDGKPLVGGQCLEFLQCFDTVGLVTGRTSGMKENQYHYFSKGFLLEQVEEKIKRTTGK